MVDTMGVLVEHFAESCVMSETRIETQTSAGASRSAMERVRLLSRFIFENEEVA